MSPKSKKQFEGIRQRSVATIKEVALELFARNGFHSTSIGRITREAGISKGLIYNYFESKEALLHAIITDAVELGDDLMEKITAGSGDPYEQLKTVVETSFDMVKANPRYWKLLTSLAFQPDVLKSVENTLQPLQEKTIRQMVDIFIRMGAPQPDKEAFLFGAMLDGIMMHYLQMEEQYPLDEMKDFVLKRYSRTEKK
jgi:AcrR family transcriptional regulator